MFRGAMEANQIYRQQSKMVAAESRTLNDKFDTISKQNSIESGVKALHPHTEIGPTISHIGITHPKAK